MAAKLIILHMVATVCLADVPREAAAKFDLPSLCRIVQPMEHELGSRLPLLMWNCPLPRGDRLFTMRRLGSLQRAVQDLYARGYVPTVDLGWNWTPAGALALARTLEEQGLPVHILIPQADLLETWAWRHSEVRAEGPDAIRGGAVRKWPCLPDYSTSDGANYVASLLQPFADAGITVDAVWFDDEALPHASNGVYDAQRNSADCRSFYPPGVLDDYQAFLEYVMALRGHLMSEVFADPVHRLFPGALVGNYFDYASSRETPFRSSSGFVHPPKSLGRMDAMMPSAYAHWKTVAALLRKDPNVSQSTIDQRHFESMILPISTALANKPAGKYAIPYVSRLAGSPEQSQVRAGLNAASFREVVWHAFLRGADSIYVFNLGHRRGGVLPQDSFESLEDVRSVYDAMLGFSDFLEHGEPMNFELPAPETDNVIWSGLRLGDRALVRTFRLVDADETVDVNITLWPGSSVILPASAVGQLFMVRHDGEVTEIDG